MGLLMMECWWSTLRLSWFGHQSRFDVPMPAVGLEDLPVTGHLLSLIFAVLSGSSFFATIEHLSERTTPAGARAGACKDHLPTRRGSEGRMGPAEHPRAQE